MFVLPWLAILLGLAHGSALLRVRGGLLYLQLRLQQPFGRHQRLGARSSPSRASRSVLHSNIAAHGYS